MTGGHGGGLPERRIAERAAYVLVWIGLGLAGLFALLSGLAADGCSDAECDWGVQRAWLVLMVAHAGIGAGGIVIGGRTSGWLRVLATAGLLALSVAAIVVYFAFIDRYL